MSSEATTTTDETIAAWLAAPDPLAQVATHLRVLERENLTLAAELRRARHQGNTYKKELERERQRANLAERQAAGIDEDAFDPAKQKGIGAIPIGGDFRAVEAIEALYGMGPTLDQKMTELGAGEAIAQLASKNPDAVDVALEQLPKIMFARVLQILWAARAVLTEVELLDDGNPDEVQQARHDVVKAIEELPMKWFEEYLDLRGRDTSELGMPPVRETRR